MSEKRAISVWLAPGRGRGADVEQQDEVGDRGVERGELAIAPGPDELVGPPDRAADGGEARRPREKPYA